MFRHTFQHTSSTKFAYKRCKLIKIKLFAASFLYKTLGCGYSDFLVITCFDSLKTFCLLLILNWDSQELWGEGQGDQNNLIACAYFKLIMYGNVQDMMNSLEKLRAYHYYNNTENNNNNDDDHKQKKTTTIALCENLCILREMYNVKSLCSCFTIKHL